MPVGGLIDVGKTIDHAGGSSVDIKKSLCVIAGTAPPCYKRAELRTCMPPEG
jgi:hypothetical protein